VKNAISRLQPAGKNVIAVATPKGVIADFAQNRVVPGPAFNQVIASTRPDRVVANTSVNRVVASTPIHLIKNCTRAGETVCIIPKAVAQFAFTRTDNRIVARQHLDTVDP
jgi:hypothetical protein